MRHNDLSRTEALPNSLRFFDERDLVAMGVAGSIHTLRSWRNRKCGPEFVKAGRLVRYRLSDIERFMNSAPNASE